MKAAVLIGALTGAIFAAPTEVKGTRVEGRVINSITSEPIRKATVSLMPAGRRGGPGGGSGGPQGGGNAGYDAVTDNGGSFKIEGVPDGDYRLSAERTGFVRPGAGSNSGPLMLRLAARGDSDSQAVTIKLIPQGVLSGRILDEDGDPMERAEVQLLRRTITGGKRQLTVLNGTSTNDLGEFRLAGVSPGRYWLAATRGGRGGGFGFRGGPGARPPVRRAESERNYVPLFYPDAEDSTRASEISVAAGQQVQGLEMRMRKGNTYHVRGRVQGIQPSESSERFGGPGAMVFIAPADTNGWSPDRRPAPVSPRDGTFDLDGVRPGRYILTATQMRRDSRRTARVPVDVRQADIEGLDLSLQDSPGIKGRVVMEGEGEMTEMSLSLFGDVGSQFGGTYARVKKDDGTFTTSPADPGHYRAQLSGLPQGFYLKSIHYGDREAKIEGFDIAPGGGELKFTIASGAPVVRGVVKDAKGDPAANVTVSVAPRDSLAAVWDLYRIVKTDQQGAFEFTLQPGAFRFYAWEQIDPGDHQDTVLLEKYSSKSASEKLSAKDQKNIELKLIPVE